MAHTIHQLLKLHVMHGKAQKSRIGLVCLATYATLQLNGLHTANGKKNIKLRSICNVSRHNLRINVMHSPWSPGKYHTTVVSQQGTFQTRVAVIWTNKNFQQMQGNRIWTISAFSIAAERLEQQPRKQRPSKDVTGLLADLQQHTHQKQLTSNNYKGHYKPNKNLSRRSSHLYPYTSFTFLSSPLSNHPFIPFLISFPDSLPCCKPGPGTVPERSLQAQIQPQQRLNLVHFKCTSDENNTTQNIT